MVEREKKGRPTAMSGVGGPGEHHYQIGIYRLAIRVGPVAYVQPMHMRRLVSQNQKKKKKKTGEYFHMMLADAFGSGQKLIRQKLIRNDMLNIFTINFKLLVFTGCYQWDKKIFNF